MSSFMDGIKSKSSVIGVIGQGYVGLPLALVFCEAGFRVIGFDVDVKKVDALTKGSRTSGPSAPIGLVAASGRVASQPPRTSID